MLIIVFNRLLTQNPKPKKKPKDFSLALTGRNILLIFHQEMWKEGRNTDSENAQAMCSKSITNETV